MKVSWVESALHWYAPFIAGVIEKARATELRSIGSLKVTITRGEVRVRPEGRDIGDERRPDVDRRGRVVARGRDLDVSGAIARDRAEAVGMPVLADVGSARGSRPRAAGEVDPGSRAFPDLDLIGRDVGRPTDGTPRDCELHGVLERR